MHKKQIGYIGETLAKLKFSELNYQIFVPECENTEYDFIAVKDGRIIPLQVKTTEKIVDNICRFDFRKNYSNASGNHAKEYEYSPLFVIVCLENNYVGVLNKTANSIMIRFSDTLNGQFQNVNYAKDFLLTDDRIISLI